MLDIIARAKGEKVPRGVLAEIEGILEFSLGEIAEEHYKRSKDKDWDSSYTFAANLLSPYRTHVERLRNEFPPILEVHAKANIKNLTYKNFISTARDKGAKAVLQAFTNIIRWNRKINPEKSKWAEKILSDLESMGDSLFTPIEVEDIIPSEEDKFVMDLSDMKTGTQYCKCPNCGLEMESTGRACETIECPKCPGIYLMVKE